MNLEKWKILLHEASPDGVDCHSVADDKGNGSAVEIETGILLYGLVRRLRPVCICETGTHWGFSTACLALGLQDNHIDYPHLPHGLVYTVDLVDYSQNGTLWDKLELNGFIHKMVEDSQTCHVPESIDCLFLDADHDTQFVLNEWRHFAPALNPEKALVLCHDTRLDVRTGPAMEEIVRQLRAAGRTVGYCPFRNMRGLDMIWLYQ